jgi:hypothetical protein
VLEGILLCCSFSHFSFSEKITAKSSRPSKDSGGRIIEEMQVFPVSVPVTNMMIHRDKVGGGVDGSSEEPRLVVSSQSEIASLKLQRCYSDKVSTCR